MSSSPASLINILYLRGPCRKNFLIEGEDLLISSRNDEYPQGWGFLQFPLEGRLGKPRAGGLTMVMDKGLGLSEINDLLDLASDYVDFIKLGFGTSALYPLPLLEKKIDIAASHGVGIYPGGTFLEVAILQGRLNKYLRTCRGLGFTAEVSDGTMDLSAGISRYQEGGYGFTFSEVGKKDPRDITASPTMSRHEDLVNGAFKVIKKEEIWQMYIYKHVRQKRTIFSPKILH